MKELTKGQLDVLNQCILEKVQILYQKVISENCDCLIENSSILRENNNIPYQNRIISYISRENLESMTNSELVSRVLVLEKAIMNQQKKPHEIYIYIYMYV